jgi:hypothetical protein
MYGLPTVLKALTTCASGNKRCTPSPPESLPATASLGGMPLLKSSGFVVSMTTLPRQFSGSAARSALSLAAPSVASTMTSPNAAASAKVPAEAFGPICLAQARAFSLLGLRDPILTS